MSQAKKSRLHSKSIARAARKAYLYLNIPSAARDPAVAHFFPEQGKVMLYTVNQNDWWLWLLAPAAGCISFESFNTLFDNL